MLNRVGWWVLWVAGLPLTVLGCLVHLLGVGVPFMVDADGVVHWRAARWGIHAAIFRARLAGAYTLGASICWPSLGASWNQAAMRHEKRHVFQGLAWAGAALALYLLSYGLLAGYSAIRCGNIWCANPWEQDAIHAEGQP